MPDALGMVQMPALEIFDSISVLEVAVADRTTILLTLLVRYVNLIRYHLYLLFLQSSEILLIQSLCCNADLIAEWLS